MILIEDKLISDDVFKKEFVCNLNACKGICCVEGDAGAPLDPEEAPILDKIYDQVEPYLNESGKKAIKEQGKYTQDLYGHHETPLVNGKECAYVYFEEGIAWCAIEKAWKEGKIDYQKPISCHLYPIRISESPIYEVLNYEVWDICDPACWNGKKLGVPVYKFLKGPLTRKYGLDFYQKIEEIADELEDQSSSR